MSCYQAKLSFSAETFFGSCLAGKELKWGNCDHLFFAYVMEDGPHLFASTRKPNKHLKQVSREDYTKEAMRYGGSSWRSPDLQCSGLIQELCSELVSTYICIFCCCCCNYLLLVALPFLKLSSVAENHHFLFALNIHPTISSSISRSSYGRYFQSTYSLHGAYECVVLYPVILL